MVWKPINHPDIHKGYLVSPQGYIKAEGSDDKDCIDKPTYHSTNGYDFVLLHGKDMETRLFPLDEIVAYAYIDIPKSLQSKPIKVSHINGDTRDITLGNLEWIEDIEEWRICTYPNIRSNMYEVSSWGRIRNISTSQFLHPSKCIDGKYLCVRLMHEDVTSHSFTHLLHVIIAHEWCKGLIDGKMNINHIDGNGLNDSPKNLEIVSHYDNCTHAIITGLKKTKLSDDLVKHICELLSKYKGNINSTLMKLKSEKHDEITIYDISDIKRQRSYHHITKMLNVNDFENNKLSEDDVHLVCRLLIDKRYNMSPSKVLEALKSLGISHISIQTIYMIKGKFTWSKISDNYF